MNVVRIHCPACEAAYEVSAANAATALEMRCGRCGLLFPAKASSDDALAEKSPLGPAEPHGGIPPPPPSVIYLSSASRPAGPDSASVSRSSIRDHAGPVFDSARNPSSTGADDRLWFSGHENTVERMMGPPGPPPPYRPINFPPRPAPPRPEMVEALPAPLGNLRSIGALGPPPPYRPIVQVGSTFDRGPAPDLEPWRQGGFIRLEGVDSPRSPAGDEVEENWSINRDAGPAIAAATRHGLENRLEPPPDIGQYELPVASLNNASARSTSWISMFRGRVRRGATRRVFWAAGVGVTVMAVGLTLAADREVVLRTIPGASRIYIALGLKARQPVATTPCDRPNPAEHPGPQEGGANCDDPRSGNEPK